MRKADYATLAAVIARNIKLHTALRDNALTPLRAAEYDHCLLCYQALAEELSKLLSVDRAAFLKACGMS